MQNYYRPAWTCGRFEEKSKSAIYFNLIEGLSYFFEDYSAILIGAILSYQRGDVISISSLSERTGISATSISPFLQELAGYNLLTERLFDEAEIKEYRESAYQLRLNEEKSDGPELLPMSSLSTSEKDYAKRTGKNVINVMFELTYNCSEKCIHCYNPGASRNDTERIHRGGYLSLSLTEYKQIIDQFYDQGMIRACLSGGDPFSNPDVWDIIEYLYQKEVAVDIYTNGQNLIGREEQLASFFPCCVGLSIYSSDSNVHDSITRIKGSWNKTIIVLENLSKLAVPTEVKCCVMRQNFKAYLGVAEIAKKYGAYLQLESSIFDSFDGDRCVRTFERLLPEQMEIALCDTNNPLYVGSLNSGRQVHDPDSNACGAGYQSFCVTPDGILILCPSFHAKVGDLKKQSLNEILTNSHSLIKWQDLKMRFYDECGKHSYCDYCKVCPGLNFAENGSPLKAGENNCYVAKIRYKIAEKIKRGEDPLGGYTISEAIERTRDNNIHSPERVMFMSNYNKEIN